MLAVVVASCSGGSSSSSSKDKNKKKSSGAVPARVQPVGPELAIAKYLESQGLEYAGDCATAKLPADKGKWCSTLVPGDSNDNKKVYEIGPVGSKPVKVITVNRRGQAKLTPGTQVGVQNGDVGQPQALTLEQIAGDAFIAGNLLLDQQAGIGNGLADIKPGAPSTPGGTGSGGTGSGGGTGGGGGTEPTYPPNGGVEVPNPNVPVNGETAFKGSGCAANEVLTVSFDGTPVGTSVSGPDGTFAGSVPIPPGTKPGQHVVTVKGAVCVLNATITVGGKLAYTGAPDHTSTLVLAGLAAVVLGSVLVIGSRRRRRGVAGPSGSPPASA